MGYLFAVLGGYLLGCSNMAFYLEKMTKKVFVAVAAEILALPIR